MAIALAAINARLIVLFIFWGIIAGKPTFQSRLRSGAHGVGFMLDIVENVLDIVQTQGHVYFDPKRTSLTWSVRLMLIRDKI
jgi:hypothetical protein